MCKMNIVNEDIFIIENATKTLKYNAGVFDLSNIFYEFQYILEDCYHTR